MLYAVEHSIDILHIEHDASIKDIYIYKSRTRCTPMYTGGMHNVRLYITHVCIKC